ncbi:MAG: glycosyltransferase family 4 protein [bacterium]
MATACWEFPIYSQNFVYQELAQLARNGFALRFLYFHHNSEVPLPGQFAPLWRARRRVILHPAVCRGAFDYFNQRMPEKVKRLIGVLRQASGMSEPELQQHRHFMQAFACARVVAAYRPDYLHSYFFYEGTLFALVAAFLLDIPRGLSCYTDHMLDDYELKLAPLHLEHCRLVIATSARIKQELIDIAPHAESDRIIVKPNAINVAPFPVMNRQEPQNGQPYRLLCVSRIDPKKVWHYLVEAVRILRDRHFNVELHLLGAVDGSQTSENYAQALDQQIAALQLHQLVHLEGRKAEAEIKQFMSNAHIFVTPFIETENGDKDGIPTALLEAMSTGLSIVATDAGSISEVIDNGHDGVLVQQRNASALAHAIADLIKNPERRRRLGQTAAAKIRAQFDVNVCERIFHRRLREILT